MVKLNEGAFQQGEQVQMHWFATPPAGTKRSATADPVFWTHVARKLRAMARVSVMPEDGMWYQELLCVVAEGRDIRMHELGYWELEDTSDVGNTQVIEDRRVEWGGPKHLWRVVRDSDGVVLAKNLRTRGDANHWISVNTPRRVA